MCAGVTPAQEATPPKLNRLREQAMADATQNDTTTKIGKMIFYITCAVGLWFFYWFAGIQCPC